MQKRSSHPLYRVWHDMCSRCENPKRDYYQRYGGRGIIVCQEWRRNPGEFITWALNNGWRPGLWIDRIDNDGHYTPRNVRFITPRQNTLNRALKSQYGPGVTKARKKYVARAKVNGKLKRIGLFTTIEAARAAYQQFIESLKED